MAIPIRRWSLSVGLSFLRHRDISGMRIVIRIVALRRRRVRYWLHGGLPAIRRGTRGESRLAVRGFALSFVRTSLDSLLPFLPDAVNTRVSDSVFLAPLARTSIIASLAGAGTISTLSV